jgi:hypothetical protein
MPNWFNNTLTITCDKKHKDELKRFKELANGKGVIKKKDFEKERDLFLSTNKEQYKKELRLDDWVNHSTMDIKKFLTEILHCTKQNDGTFLKGDSDMSMKKIMPCPTELLNITSPVRAENGETEKQFKQRVEKHQKQYGATDWYNWQVANWGTKWDVDANLVSKSDTELTYTFDSAWSPPIQFFVTASPKFPNLKFVLEYDEPGMCFRGTATIENGDLDDKFEENYTPTCHDCEEEFDDNGECSCTREKEPETVLKEISEKKKKK